MAPDLAPAVAKLCSWDGSESPSIATGLQSGFADNSFHKPSGVAPNAPGKSNERLAQPKPANLQLLNWADGRTLAVSSLSFFGGKPGFYQQAKCDSEKYLF